MIKPYGSSQLACCYVEDANTRATLLQSAASLPSLTVSSATAANAVMLAAGYFNPLRGYMNRADGLSVAEEMRMQDGLFWPVPLFNLSKGPAPCQIGDSLALRDPNVTDNPVLAIQQVENIETLTDDELNHIALQVYGTLDKDHPGVKTFLSQGNTLISGPIEVLNYSYFAEEFPQTFRTAAQIRSAMNDLGWQKVVAFQTRNPMHRAHEELCKMALERLGVDGVLIHMLLGRLKPGDIPANVRDAAIRKMVELYFPKNTVLIAGYGFDMLYAGPKEALLHAVFRQNCGCSHLIVGRDHAGVGDYYGAFDAQEIFTRIPENALGIEIFAADHTAYSRKLGKVVMMREATDHNKEDFVLLSGTKVREMLAAGEELPPEFARPEVAHILMQHYQQT